MIVDASQLNLEKLRVNIDLKKGIYINGNNSILGCHPVLSNSLIEGTYSFSKDGKTVSIIPLDNILEIALYEEDE